MFGVWDDYLCEPGCCTEHIAPVMMDEQQAIWAARLCSAADALRIQLDAPRPPADQAMYQQIPICATYAFGDAAFRSAQACGQAMLLDATVAELMQVLESKSHSRNSER